MGRNETNMKMEMQDVNVIKVGKRKSKNRAGIDRDKICLSVKRGNQNDRIVKRML